MHQDGNSLEDRIKAFLTPGSGYGSGYGYGSGSGYGYGDGYGDGSGYGSGDGDGSGDGEGRKVKQINNEPVYVIDDVPTVIRQCHGDVARGAILQDDLQLAPCYIVKGGGYWAHGETLEQAREALEEKILDDLPVEQKIEEFLEKFQTGIKYPAMDFYRWHHFLTGSCEMGRKQFAKNHGIDLEKDELTPEQFMILTMDDFGSSVIRQLMDEWNKKYPDAKVTSSPHPSR